MIVKLFSMVNTSLFDLNILFKNITNCYLFISAKDIKQPLSEACNYRPVMFPVLVMLNY